LPPMAASPIQPTVKTEPSLTESLAMESRSFQNRLDRLKNQLSQRSTPLSLENLARLEDLLNQAEEISLTR
jgi:hypothetical protein